MIASFNQISLTNNLISASGGNLTVNGVPISGGTVFGAITSGNLNASLSGVNLINYIPFLDNLTKNSSSLIIGQFDNDDSMITFDIPSENIIFDSAGGQVVSNINLSISSGAHLFISGKEIGQYFYPLTGNPSNFITTGQTGAFGTAINTGNFLVNNNTIITGSLSLSPSLPTGVMSLGSNPFYIFTGTNSITWGLPTINTTTGRVYFLKNRGTVSLTISGNVSDQIYSNAASNTFLINPGEAYIMINDSQYWSVN